MGLSKRRIIAAGMAILDEYGLADLTMRRLADALGVKAGALYWHFPNKQTLLAGLADEILREMPESAPQEALAAWLSQWAAGLRSALLRHRDAAELVASARAMNLGQLDPTASLRDRLQAAGFEADDALAIAQALLHFLLGHVMQEQTQSQLVALGVLDVFDSQTFEAHFNRGIELLVAGVLAGKSAG